MLRFSKVSIFPYQKLRFKIKYHSDLYNILLLLIELKDILKYTMNNIRIIGVQKAHDN